MEREKSASHFLIGGLACIRLLAEAANPLGGASQAINASATTAMEEANAICVRAVVIGSIIIHIQASTYTMTVPHAMAGASALHAMDAAICVDSCILNASLHAL